MGIDKPSWYNAEHTELFVTFGLFYKGTQDLEANNILIEDNIVSSVSFFAYHLPGNTCGFSGTPKFGWNSAHSSKAGFFGLQLGNQNCQEYQHLLAYFNSDEGFSNRFDMNNLTIKKMVLADNKNSVSINGGSKNGQRFPLSTFKESVVYGQALSDCTFCYTTPEGCNNSGVYSSLFDINNYFLEFT